MYINCEEEREREKRKGTYLSSHFRSMMPLSHVLPIFSDLSRSNVKSYLTLSLHIKVNQQEEKEDKRVEREGGKGRPGEEE